MGIFGSIKKSSEIKKITKLYFESGIDFSRNLADQIRQGVDSGDVSPVAIEIYSFLLKNKPFKGLLTSDPIFRQVNASLISKIIEDFERVGLGNPYMVAGHCPAISCFFFEDILYFLTIAHAKKDSSEANYMQLLNDVESYFRTGELVFSPSIDPRN